MGRWLLGLLLFLWASTADAGIKEVMEATCQIKLQVKDKVITGGTGTLFLEDKEKIYILTAGHVVDKKHDKLCIFFFNTGKASHCMYGEVVFKVYEGVKDVAIVSVTKVQFKNYPIPMPIPLAQKDTILKKDMKIVSCGCPNYSWPNALLGHVRSIDSTTFSFIPEPIPGRSGSGMFDEDGTHIVGLLIQYDKSDGGFGVAVSLEHIYKYTDNLKVLDHSDGR